MAKKDFIIDGKDVKPINDRSLGKDISSIIGVGLTAGALLIAGTNYVMNKFTKKEEEKEEQEQPEKKKAKCPFSKCRK